MLLTRKVFIGIMQRNMKSNVLQLPSELSLLEMQMIALTCSSHILNKILSMIGNEEIPKGPRLLKFACIF